MATLYGSTTSNGATIFDPDAVRRILDTYSIDPGEGMAVDPLEHHPATDAWTLEFWIRGDDLHAH